MKKLSLLSTIVFILICSLSFSESGHMVAVTAEKEVPVQQDDVAAARTMALLMAARDAVEKAYGTYVNVKELPEGREILAKAAADVKYTVLAEQQRGKKYWVKIQANIMVPDRYVTTETEQRETLGEPMKNFLQKYPQGEINWGDGFLTAYGKGEISDKGGATAEEMAARAAEVDAKAHLLEIINDIPVDDRMKTGQDKRMSFALEGFIQGAQVVARSKSGREVHVTVQVPIRGVQGLTTVIYGMYKVEPPPPPEQKPKPAPVQEAKKFTGVVIDARKAPVSPAIFIKVKDTKKRQVVNASFVNKDDLLKRGMASYAVVSRDVQISKIFPHALVLPVLYSPGTETRSANLPRRQGETPLLVGAVDAEGELKTDIIISDEDAARLAALDQTSDALKQCRIIVVLSESL